MPRVGNAGKELITYRDAARERERERESAGGSQREESRRHDRDSGKHGFRGGTECPRIARKGHVPWK